MDIKLKPDAEIRENVLMNKVYTKLHKALCDMQATNIGISFPNHKIKLGNVIRAHSVDLRLKELQGSNWLGGLVGYCEISEILPVPGKVKYRTVSRKQANMTAAKLRRLKKRGSITNAEVKKYKAKMFAQGLGNPYVELKSLSNGHMHRRYIEFGDLKERPVEGVFDKFGLSKVTTIPWF